ADHELRKIEPRLRREVELGAVAGRQHHALAHAAPLEHETKRFGKPLRRYRHPLAYRQRTLVKAHAADPVGERRRIADRHGRSVSSRRLRSSAISRPGPRERLTEALAVSYWSHTPGAAGHISHAAGGGG